MYKILVADDEEDFLKGISIRLKSAGFEGILVRDGREVINSVSEEKPDLIVLDIMMPNMDGFETTKILKSNPETKDIPIIFLTAGAFDFGEVIDDLASGQDFMLKTVDGDKIVERINMLLGD
ncbi:PleD family two-component system response regulator [candidate division KSB1 bacterium]